MGREREASRRRKRRGQGEEKRGKKGRQE